MIEILTGVLCFLNIVDVAFKVKDKFKGQQEKEGASYFLNRIGDLLNAVANDLEKNIYPYDKCSEMQGYLTGFQSVLKNKIPDEQLVYLETQIAQAYQVERLLGELNQMTPALRQVNINTLKNTAGSFYAASTLVKM